MNETRGRQRETKAQARGHNHKCWKRDEARQRPWEVDPLINTNANASRLHRALQ